MRFAAITILVASIFSVSVFYSSPATTREEIADSIHKDSLALVDRINFTLEGLQPFDDTIRIASEKPEYLISVKCISYRNRDDDPNPQFTNRKKLPFYVDTIRRTDSSLIVELYGIYSGGAWSTGTVSLKNNKLLLIHWEEEDQDPRIGSYFKWTLVYEINYSGSQPIPEITIVNRNGCLYHRAQFIQKNGFSLAKKLLAKYLPPVKKERYTNPQLPNIYQGDAVYPSYRQFDDTTLLVTKKDLRLLNFEYSFPEYTPEEIKSGLHRYYSPDVIGRKHFADDVLTITVAGNNSTRYKMDGNIYISGDTVFLVTWPTAPEESFAMARFKCERTYSISTKKKDWNFAVVDLFTYVHRHKEWYREKFPK